MDEDPVEIDDSLYSRQRYMLGDQAMQKMAHSSVFLSGLGGLGVEIAKNVVLAGIKSITLHDSQVATTEDLGSQFFIREEDVATSQNRAEASATRVAELNPYVTVKTNTHVIDENNLNFLNSYQCVIFTDAPLNLQIKADQYCRCHKPSIQFINVRQCGVFGSIFCDFGDDFEVLDVTGEESKEFFVGNITKDNPGVVTTLDNTLHGLETGDVVTFKEVVGMTALNNLECTVSKVLSPYAFTICDTTSGQFQPYQYGGIASQVKPSSTHLRFESLECQLQKPDILIADLCKTELPLQLHFILHALQVFENQHGCLPKILNVEDASSLVQIVTDLNSKAQCKADTINSDVIQQLSFASRGCFPPLAAALGGIAAQEVLKGLTGKYMPIKQWLYLDCVELLRDQQSIDSSSFLPRSDRYDPLRVCVGDEVVRKMADLRMFMVGCGAIGCEFLKNFALLGISSGDNGQLAITDNDLIEKSNLNRQFLFRPHHIQKAKSTTAAQSTMDINPGMHIRAEQQKGTI